MGFTIKLPALTRRQTSDSKLGNLIKDWIDRRVDVVRIRGTAAANFGNNLELRLGTKARFQRIPPGKFRAGAPQFNEKERGAHACPEYDKRRPVMRRHRSEEHT